MNLRSIIRYPLQFLVLKCHGLVDEAVAPLGPSKNGVDMGDGLFEAYFPSTQRPALTMANRPPSSRKLSVANGRFGPVWLRVEVRK